MLELRGGKGCLLWSRGGHVMYAGGLRPDINLQIEQRCRTVTACRQAVCLQDAVISRPSVLLDLPS